jgi:outer membrane protein OmpA-like peptidoglycan-associated protein
VPARRADLLVDQVQVVEQPLAGRRDAVAGADRLGQQRATVVQYRLVRIQPPQQRIRARGARGKSRPCGLAAGRAGPAR